MKIFHRVLVLLVALSMTAAPLHAEVEGPLFESLLWTDREVVEFDVRYSACDVPEDQQAAISVSAGIIAVVIYGSRYDGLLCTLTVPISRSVVIGQLVADDYEVVVDYQFLNVLDDTIDVERVGHAEVVVSEVQPIPSITGVGAMALFVALLLAGLATVRGTGALVWSPQRPQSSDLGDG